MYVYEKICHVARNVFMQASLTFANEIDFAKNPEGSRCLKGLSIRQRARLAAYLPLTHCSEDKYGFLRYSHATFVFNKVPINRLHVLVN